MKGGTDRKLPRSLEIHTSKLLANHQHTSERKQLISTATVSAKNQEIHNYVPVRPNANRDVSIHSMDGSPNEQLSSAHSSIVYSSVLLANQNKLSTVLVEDVEKTPPPLQIATSEDEDPVGQLTLKTTRDANGQLKLTSVHFHVEKLESKKDLVLAQLNRLNSSESSDSGCVDETLNTPTPRDSDSTHSDPLGVYLRNDVLPKDVNPTSEYKQNWMPLIAPKDKQDYVSRDQPWGFSGFRETEEGDLNDNAGMPGKFLQGWVLQIQE
ncbi:uncharacterized protein LOC130914293 [Corythoichthys intestinalis]|uniref:uncharacterized protein LOC130914293 n=1 Tax=Corythoichthys intestinalis TaxID=161448 RepID=UPI0025A56484|nr:uncharacterized protein LOC130914293 [Corythoichthys intestinalis]